MHELNHYLDRWLRWYKLHQTRAWMLRGLNAGLIGSLIISSIALPRGLLLHEEYLHLVLAASLAGMALPALAVWLRPFSRLQAARFFDQRFGLQERVSTALELASKEEIQGSTPRPEQQTRGALRNRGSIGLPEHGLYRLQLADALTAARSVNPQTVMPIRLPRREIVLAVLLCLLVASLWMRGEPYFHAARQARLINQTLTEETARVENLLGKASQIETLSSEGRQAISKPLRKALQELRAARSLEQAVSALNTAQAEIKSIIPSQLQEQVHGLKTAGEHLYRGAENDLQKFGQSLVEENFQAAASELESFDLTRMSPAERETLARQIEMAAETFAGTNPGLSGRLQSAAEALQNGELESAQRELQQAAKHLNETVQDITDYKPFEQVAEELGQSAQRLAHSGDAAQGLAQNQSSDQVEAAGSSLSQPAGKSAGDGVGESQAAGRQVGETGRDPLQVENDPETGGERVFEQIYAPSRLGGADGPELTLPGNDQPGDQASSPVTVPPGDPSPSSVPYVEVFAEYREAYRQAIESGQIPVHLRALIREYFSSLEP